MGLLHRMELLISRAVLACLLAAFLWCGAGADGNATPRALWEKKVCPAPATAPVISGDTVWVAGTDRKLRSIDAETGKRHWKKGLPGFPTTPVAPSADLLVLGIGTGDRGVCAVDRHSGKVRWFEKTLAVPIDLIVSGRQFFSVSAGGELSARNLTDGSVVWTRPLGIPAAGFELNGNDLYVLGKRDSLWCFETSAGERRWAVPVVGSHSAGPLVAPAGLLRLRYDGQLTLHDPKTGVARRRATLAGPQINRPVIIGNHLFAAATGGEVECWELGGMTRTWLVLSHETTAAGAAVWSEWVVVPTAKGRVFGMTGSRGARAWTLTFRDPITRPPGIDGDRLALIDDRGRMVVYRWERPS